MIHYVSTLFYIRNEPKFISLLKELGDYDTIPEYHPARLPVIAEALDVTMKIQCNAEMMIFSFDW